MYLPVGYKLHLNWVLWQLKKNSLNLFSFGDVCVCVCVYVPFPFSLSCVLCGFYPKWLSFPNLFLLGFLLCGNECSPREIYVEMNFIEIKNQYWTAFFEACWSYGRGRGIKKMKKQVGGKTKQNTFQPIMISPGLIPERSSVRLCQNHLLSEWCFSILERPILLFSGFVILSYEAEWTGLDLSLLTVYWCGRKVESPGVQQWTSLPPEDWECPPLSSFCPQCLG